MGQQGNQATQPVGNVFQGSAQALQGAGQVFGNAAMGGANPATQQYIQQTQNNMMRQQQMQQNQLDAQASQAGAFGGSRHGVAQGMMVDDYSRRMADMAAQQNLQAQDMAMRGASGLAGMGGQLYNIGQNTSQMVSSQGAFQRQLEQQLANAALGQTNQVNAQPLAGLGALSSVLSQMRPNTTTTASSPYSFAPLLGRTLFGGGLFGGGA